MNAVIAEKSRMIEEDRIARIESDVATLKGDVRALNTCVSDFRMEVARAELRRSFESLRATIDSLQVWSLGTGVMTVMGVAVVLDWLN